MSAGRAIWWVALALRTLPTDTAKPSIFKRPADQWAPWRPIGRAA